MRISLPNNWRPRPYQMPLWAYLERGGREAVAVWHRRAGKDEVGLHRACVAAHERKANYWHMLPEAAQARKAIWDAINPKTGIRRIDEAFPLALRETTREQEMLIKLKVGSTWQVVGSDNFNSLVGSPPAGIVYSEWSIAKPQARAYLRPIIAENNGWEVFIYTPRGRNHGLATLKAAQTTPGAFAQVLTADDTGVIPQSILDSEREAYRKEYGEDEGDALFRQEYYCDFNAPLLGAILGRYIDRAESSGRVNDTAVYDPQGGPVEVSSDIGYRDTASWWFWQPKVGGFSLVGYDEGTGMDADDWIDRLKKCPFEIGKIWLPHDARVKTFQSKHSSLERFLLAFGPDRVGIVPTASKSDRINAARVILPRCEFNRTACDAGLEGLRAWSYEWNDDLKTYSKEPRHDWASHPGDAFSYGAQIMREREIKPVEKDAIQEMLRKPTLDELWQDNARRNEERI